MKRVRLTRHGFERITERLSISLDEVKRIVRDGLTTRVKREPGTQKVHLRFYSPTDRKYFIVVKDERSGSIITILPCYGSGRRRLPNPVFRTGFAQKAKKRRIT